MNGKVARKLRRASGNRGRYKALKRLYNAGKVITGGTNELRTQPKKEVTEEDRRAQAQARASQLAQRPAFAKYAPIKKNTAQRKLGKRPDSALARERRSWRVR